MTFLMPRMFLCAFLAVLLTRPALGQSADTDSLHVGAHVRVRILKLSPDWITGSVVTMQRVTTCLAIRLDRTDAQGRGQYAFFTSVSAMEVDRRTNDGVLRMGISEPEPDDWMPWPQAQVVAIAKSCQR